MCTVESFGKNICECLHHLSVVDVEYKGTIVQTITDFFGFCLFVPVSFLLVDFEWADF